MSDDLFLASNRLERCPIQDAEVYYRRSLVLERSADSILDQLIAETPWRSESIVVWGRTIAQPRLIAWYGDRGRSYSYSGIRLEPRPWTDVLADLKSRIETACATRFNSVLLNYYRDNRDSVGFHSDDEPDLGDRPIIASLSLGEERTLVFKHKRERLAGLVRLTLASGSLLLMKGPTQQNWNHGILKERHACGPRVNLTFRRIRM
jgi:alkylated DNA repair dioxygenase AlkB